MTKGVQALLTTLDGRSKDKVEGSVVDYLVLPLPFPLSVRLPSVRGESGGLASGGVSLPFRLPLPLPLPFPLPFPLPLGGAPIGWGKSAS